MILAPRADERLQANPPGYQQGGADHVPGTQPDENPGLRQDICSNVTSAQAVRVTWRELDGVRSEKPALRGQYELNIAACYDFSHGEASPSALDAQKKRKEKWIGTLSVTMPRSFLWVLVLVSQQMGAVIRACTIP
jgi:hypothetical protein